MVSADISGLISNALVQPSNVNLLPVSCGSLAHPVFLGEGFQLRKRSKKWSQTSQELLASGARLGETALVVLCTPPSSVAGTQVGSIIFVWGSLAQF